MVFIYCIYEAAEREREEKIKTDRNTQRREKFKKPCDHWKYLLPTFLKHLKLQRELDAGKKKKKGGEEKQAGETETLVPRFSPLLNINSPCNFKRTF